MDNSTIKAIESRGVAMEEEFISQEPNFEKVDLTKNLAEMLNSFSKTTDAPDEFMLMSLLTCWAGVVANKVSGHNLRPNIWSAIFAGSSELRKSTAINIPSKPFKNVQRKLYDENDKDCHHTLILPSDFSDAGFYQLLSKNKHAGTIVATEFSDFHRKLNRDYTGLTDSFLNAYDNERMERITRTHGREVIEEPTFSILGATTFDGFKKVFSGSESENGFLQRFLPVVAINPQKERMMYLNRPEVDKKSIEKMEMKIQKWLDIKDIKCNFDLDEGYQCMHMGWEEELVEYVKNNIGDEVISFVDRLAPSCIKLAMLIETFELEDPEDETEISISGDSIRSAISIINHLIFPSIVYLLENHLVFNFPQKRLKDLEKILQNSWDPMTTTELRNKVSSNNRQYLQDDIKKLVDEGKVECTTNDPDRPQGGGKSSKYYSWKWDEL
jgi:hypothetical protein